MDAQTEPAGVWCSRSRLLRASNRPTRDSKCSLGCAKSKLPDAEDLVRHLRKMHVQGRKGPLTRSQVPDLKAMMSCYGYWYCAPHTTRTWRLLAGQNEMGMGCSHFGTKTTEDSHPPDRQCTPQFPTINWTRKQKPTIL